MMAAMHCSWFVFLFSFLALTTADFNCTRAAKENIPAGLKPVFDIPTFSADVEIYKKEAGVLKSMKLYYDSTSATVRLTILQNFNEQDYFFLFNSNELLTFMPNPGSVRGLCEVNSDMKNDPYLSVIGGPYLDPKTKKYTIPPAMDVFHFTGKDRENQDIIQEYVGMAKIRDKDVYQFESCQNWEYTEMDYGNFTAKVTHYFTAYNNSQWKYPFSMAIPVSMHVMGKFEETAVDQTWNFFNVQPFIPPFILETPSGVVCPGRKTAKPFPNLPNFLKLTYEVIDHVKKQYRIFNEIYDTDEKISVLRASSAPSTFNPADQMVIINNFRSGLSYQIDEVSKRCTIMNISDHPSPFSFNDQGATVIMTPKMFFMANDAKYTYLGMRTIRGVLCDTWVANTYNKFLKNVTAEWYFARSDIRSWNTGSYEKGYQIPMQVRIWPNQDPFFLSVINPLGQRDTYYDFNVFHVDYTKLLINVVSIKSCLTSSPSNLIQITFPLGGVGEIYIRNQQEVEWALLLQIADQAGVHWLRVSDFQLIFTNKVAVATFELLDAPPYTLKGQGSTAKPPRTLAEATDLLKKGLKAKNVALVVPIFNSTHTVVIPASPTASIKSPLYAKASDSDSGYSGGAMAGLGIAMMVVGLASGGGASYYFIYKKGVFA